MKKLIYIFLLFALPLSAQDIGGQYYVVHPDSTYAGMNASSDSNDGSFLNPFSGLQAAIEAMSTGDTVTIRGGFWDLISGVRDGEIFNISPDGYGGYGSYGCNGTSDSVNLIRNYPGEEVIFEFGDVYYSGEYFSVLGLGNINHWHFKGFTFQGVPQLRQSTIQVISGVGSNYTFEEVNIHRCGGKGFAIDGSFKHALLAPVHEDDTINIRKYLNCDASYNADSIGRQGTTNDEGNWADGFWTMEGDTTGLSWVIFDGCRAWENADDGYDTPADGHVIYLNSWAFNNGRYPGGGGQGFRFANARADSISDCAIVQCISAHNTSTGMKEGYGTGAGYFPVVVYNNTFIGNGVGINVPRLRYGTQQRNIYKNNICWNSNSYDIAVSVEPHYPDSGIYVHEHNNWIRATGYYPAFAENELPDIDPAIVTTSADFISLDTLELRQDRQSDGSLPDIDYGKLAPGSDMIGAGVSDTTFIEYVGDYETVDLGWYQSGSLINTVLYKTYGSTPYFIGDKILYKLNEE